MEVSVSLLVLTHLALWPDSIHSRSLSLGIFSVAAIEYSRVASVDEACDLAWRLLKDKRADWFRGQVSPWLPSSTLTRWQNRAPGLDKKSAEPTLNRFFAWVQRRPELQVLVSDSDRLLAVAQHFGIATDLVDFTLSPDIAALFSRDRDSEAQFDSEFSCIYCLSTTRLLDVFRSLPRQKALDAQVYPVEVELPELHRLTAQRGLFLHAPGEWYEIFPLDCIVFPRGPILDASERQQLYPPTSQLEEDLRAFLQANDTHELAEYLERSRSASVIRVGPPLNDVEADRAFLSPDAAPAEGWVEAGDDWKYGRYLTAQEPWTISFPPHSLLMGRSALACGLVIKLEEILADFEAEARSGPLLFELQATPGVLEVRDAHTVSRQLTRAWNAMRAFPFTEQQRIDAFRQILMLRRPWLDELLAAGELDGVKWLRLTLATTSGGVSTGFVSNRRLLKAFRNDLHDVLSPCGRELASSAPVELLRRVPKPQLLFDCARLLECFVSDLIPTQILTGASDRPAAFSPLTLAYFAPAD
jgi:hypothetical protein